MIDNFRDHAANERTYLAWIRTAVALMGFGFVIEKFDLFLGYIAVAIRQANIPHNRHFAEDAGLAMMIVGLALVIFSTWNFLHNLRLIDAPDKHTYRAKLPNLVLGVVVAALGIFLILYVGFALSSRMP